MTKKLHLYKAKAFTDVNVTKKHDFLLSWGKKKYCRERRKCWLPAFSLFPTIFSKPIIQFLKNSVKSGGAFRKNLCQDRENKERGPMKQDNLV